MLKAVYQILACGIYNISIYDVNGTIPVALYRDIVFIHLWSSILSTSYISVTSTSVSPVQVIIPTTTTSKATTGKYTLYYDF